MTIESPSGSHVVLPLVVMLYERTFAGIAGRISYYIYHKWSLCDIVSIDRQRRMNDWMNDVLIDIDSLMVG